MLAHTNAEMARAVAIILAIFWVVWLISSIFFVLTLRRTLKHCSPENRMIAPGIMWLLLLIPLCELLFESFLQDRMVIVLTGLTSLLGGILILFIVINMAKSIAAEFKKRGIAVEKTPGQKIGIVYAVFEIFSVIPLVGLGALICWIMYWVKINNYANMLEGTTPIVAAQA